MILFNLSFPKRCWDCVIFSCTYVWRIPSNVVLKSVMSMRYERENKTLLTQRSDDNDGWPHPKWRLHRLLPFCFGDVCHSVGIEVIFWVINFWFHKREDTWCLGRLPSYLKESPHLHGAKRNNKDNGFYRSFGPLGPLAHNGYRWRIHLFSSSDYSCLKEFIIYSL